MRWIVVAILVASVVALNCGCTLNQVAWPLKVDAGDGYGG
jgi:hypothetical protein